MWKLSICLVFALVAIDSCNTLECYICDSSTEPKCKNIKDKSLKPETCTYDKLSVKDNARTSWLMAVSELDYYKSTHQAIPMVCQKIVGTDEKQRQTTVRRCQLNHVEQCDYAKHKAIAQKTNVIEHCSVCDTDNCNASTALSFAWASMGLIIIMRIVMW